MADISASMHAALTGDAGVAALVGARVYPVQAPQEAPAPFIVFGRVATQRFPTLDDRRGLAQPRIEVGCWAETFDAARALANAVRLALDGLRGTVAGIEVLATRLDAERDDRNDEAHLYRCGLEFVITHREGI
jgi:hypothetical protein